MLLSFLKSEKKDSILTTRTERIQQRYGVVNTLTRMSSQMHCSLEEVIWITDDELSLLPKP